MKSLKDYLLETELMEHNPAVGDVFELEIAREEFVIETTVIDVVADGVVIEADDTMLKLFDRIGYLLEDSNMPVARDSTSPIHGGNDRDIDEAEYHGRNVPLGKPMAGDVAKSKVYVRDPKTGNVKKVNFGDPNMKIKKSIPARRKSFRARHHCENPGPRTSARYWSCRAW